MLDLGRYGFIVKPSGVHFFGSMFTLQGQLSSLHRAHLHAACYAQETGEVAWVESEHGPIGFGVGALFIPGSILRRIMDSGVRAFWNFPAACWQALPEETVFLQEWESRSSTNDVQPPCL